MRNLSFEAKERLADNSGVRLKATLTLADGTVRELAGGEIMTGSARFDSATSSVGSFDVGAAVMGSFGVTLNNWDGRFDGYDFTDAVIVPYVGIPLEDGVEWLLMGHYTVDQPDTYGNTIGLDCLDFMERLDRPYSDVSTLYPATLGSIVRDICVACGLVLDRDDFAGHGTVVSARPADSSLTCRAVVSYAAQMSGNYARMLPSGRLSLQWYNIDAFGNEDWLDGEDFDGATPYASGDTADGGDFLDYSGGYAADGGLFSMQRYAVARANSSISVGVDDVVVTGVKVTAYSDASGSGTGEGSLYGENGYVIAISGNPLIQAGKAADIAEQVGLRAVGMRFRPFDVSTVGNPAVEAGDAIVVVDARNRAYRSFITSVSYRPGSYETLSCGAESPGRNRASSFAASTSAIVGLGKRIDAEKTARELAVEDLGRQLEESSGLYETHMQQQDGSTIYYMHDKPTLMESEIVWKMTANALGISTDGGQTYPYGLDVSGNAILQRVYAVGIDATYVNTGALSVRDGNTEIFRADVAAGTFMVNTQNFKVSTAGVMTATSGTIGGMTIANNSIYNDAVKIEPGALTFMAHGTVDGHLVSGEVGNVYTNYSLTPNYELLGDLNLQVPYSFAMYSEIPHVGDSSSKLVIEYKNEDSASDRGLLKVGPYVEFRNKLAVQGSYVKKVDNNTVEFSIIIPWYSSAGQLSYYSVYDIEVNPLGLVTNVWTHRQGAEGGISGEVHIFGNL